LQNVKKADDDGELTSELAEDFQAVRKVLKTIDMDCIGYPREKNHEFLFSLPSYKCYIYASHGKPLGYAYVAQNGRVGPVATVSENSFGYVVESAIGFASQEEKAPSVSVNVTGSNEKLMKLAFRHGMKIRDNFLLMSSKPFPNISRYVIYPTGAML